jgi:hypothetical protein
MIPDAGCHTRLIADLSKEHESTQRQILGGGGVGSSLP